MEADLSDRLEGMRIETLTRGDGNGESVLEGRLMDQAALTGVLNTLYELHMPVMAVNCLSGLDEGGTKAPNVSR